MNRPQTGEGVLAEQLGSSPGLWKRAGQIAQVVGLDYAAIRAVITEGADWDRVYQLLRHYESGLLKGHETVAKQAEAVRRAQAEINK